MIIASTGLADVLLLYTLSARIRSASSITNYVRIIGSAFRLIPGAPPYRYFDHVGIRRDHADPVPRSR